MKLLLMFLTVLTLTGCGDKNDDGRHPDEPVAIHDPVPPVDVEPVPPVIPDPGPNPEPEIPPVIIDPEPDIVTDLSKTFKVNVSYFGPMATIARRAKYAKAIEIVKKVVALESFKLKILNYSSHCSLNIFYQSPKSNAQIYQNILDGDEMLQPVKDNEMDVEVEFYYSPTSSTVGYTYASSRRIWVNTKYFDGYAPSNVAANLFHEWLHKLGYKHDSASTPCRPYSVPYAVGYMVRDLGKQFE